MANFLLRLWYQPTIGLLSYILWPFSLIYLFIHKLNIFFQKLIYAKRKLSVPVITVGNITLGGTGKTPLVEYIVKELQQKGYNPGISIRGYKRKSKTLSMVTTTSTVIDVGDEALMLYQNTKVPVMVGKDRYDAMLNLLEHKVDIIILDDGLQNYTYPHGVEVAVIDGSRALGNGLCLPAGPLRDTSSRLSKVDFVVAKGCAFNNKDFVMKYTGDTVYNLQTGEGSLITDFDCVNAVSAIGNNESFIASLQKHISKVYASSYPDHYYYSSKDFNLGSDPIIITSKDKVKCQELDLDFSNIWVYPITATMPDTFMKQLEMKLC